METTTTFKKFDIPLKMGLVIAIIKIVFSTIQYQFLLDSWVGNSVASFVSFVVGVGFLVYIGKAQRKAMGGYIEFKEAFQAIFVAILVMVTLNYAYDLIYAMFIDPDMMIKIKESSMAWAEKSGATSETLDKMAAKFDEQNKDKYDISKLLLSFFYFIVMYSIVGLICAAIVKKKKPLDFA